MTSRTIALRDGRTLLIRDAVPDDASAILAYLEAISGESDFLTFGPGEFELNEAQEAEYLRGVNAASDQFYVIGTIDREIVASLTSRRVGGSGHGTSGSSRSPCALRAGTWASAR